MGKPIKGHDSMTPREEKASVFISGTDWAGCARSALAGDASNRRYERLRSKTGAQAVLMDAPPEKGEDIAPFMRIARYLRDIGLSAPRILAEDRENGFLLLEDLGDDLFARVAQAQPDLENTLYQAATDTLIALHAEKPPALAAYDSNIMTDMAALAFDWYQKGAVWQTDQQAKSAFRSAFHAALTDHIAAPTVLIQRDYHAENLLWLPERNGVARVGLLDFQDAMVGHPAYDLVSLLQDARRDVPPALEQAMLSYYIERAQVEPESFRASYALLGLQRNLRILGVFARLCLKSGKPGYIDMIPRVWEFIERNLQHPALQHLGPLITGPLPAPNPEILSKLRTQCATPQPA